MRVILFLIIEQRRFFHGKNNTLEWATVWLLGGAGCSIDRGHTGRKGAGASSVYAGMNEGAEITASALQSETSLTLTGSQTYKNALLLKRLILRNRRLNLIVVNWKRIKLLAELSKCWGGRHMDNLFFRMRNDFDRMIQANIPGQNHDCSIIPDYGNG